MYCNRNETLVINSSRAFAPSCSVLLALALQFAAPRPAAAQQPNPSDDAQRERTAARGQAGQGAAQRSSTDQENQNQRRGATQAKSSPENAPSGNRTDQAISQAIETALQRDENVSAHLVDVQSQNGIVTLSGTVDHLFAKELAARIAQSTRGVRQVSNQLTVRPISRTDEQIRRDIQTALAQDPAADSYEIAVNVRDGVATLTGTVDSWHERRLAADVAREVKGVKEIINQVQIDFDASRPDPEILADIQSRLDSDARVQEKAIDVQVNNGRATLSGTVGSAIEKTWAVRDAWIKGVTFVDATGLNVEPPQRSAKPPGGRADRSQQAASGAQDEARGGSAQQAQRGSGRGTDANSPSKPKLSSQKSARSDAQIEDAIRDAFLYDPRVLSFNPEIQVENGVVTLTGTVSNLKAKRSAEQDARGVTGVRRVRNFLKVRPQGPLDPDNVARNVAAALDRNVLLDDDTIAVTISNSKAYLSGQVDSAYERSRAEDIAAGILGVVDVENNLTLSQRYDIFDYTGFPGYPYYYGYNFSNWDRWPYKTDAEIQADIEDQLFWSPFVDADEVEVTVRNGVATLRGSVDDWNERSTASANALDGGAISVRNNLSVFDDYDGWFDY